MENVGVLEFVVGFKTLQTVVLASFPTTDVDSSEGRV